jgi:MerR family transcriptional regulator/heat shock protein HspR
MSGFSGNRGQPGARAAWARSGAFSALLDRLNQLRNDAAFSNAGPSEAAGVYIISVAARLAEMHPQTLRKYDREELVSPSRTGGMLRLYSDEDVQRLRTIGRLVDDLGLNLEGVRLVMGLVEVMNDVIDVLESSGELAGSEAGHLAVQELRGAIEFVSRRQQG